MASSGDEDTSSVTVRVPVLGGLTVKMAGLAENVPLLLAFLAFGGAISLLFATTRLHGIANASAGVAAVVLFLLGLRLTARALAWAGDAGGRVQFRRSSDAMSLRRHDLDCLRSVRDLDTEAHARARSGTFDPDASQLAQSVVLEYGVYRLGFERDGKCGFVLAEMIGETFVIRDIVGPDDAGYLVGKVCKGNKPIEELLKRFGTGHHYAYLHLDGKRHVLAGFATFQLGENDRACVEEIATIYQLMYSALSGLGRPQGEPAADSETALDEARAGAQLVLAQMDQFRAELVGWLPPGPRSRSLTDRGREVR